MLKISIAFVLVSLSFHFSPTYAIDPTCRGKRVNEKCTCDEDCEGPHIKCVQGKCSCPFNFDTVQLSDKVTLCRPAASAIGAACTSSCVAPLLCQNQKCVCFGPGSSTSGNQCVIKCPQGQTLVGQDCRAVSTTLGGKCTTDGDCQIPSSFCNAGKCDCIPGAAKSGSSCSLTCPDGRQPTQTCSLTMVNDANAIANGEKQDSCPKGSGCMFYGKPDIGHCCQLYCPYGNADTSKSCEAGAPSQTHCPAETHYCQSFESHGIKNSLCCPRPCKEPTPLYINDKCLPKARWGDACKEDGQCSGGSTMQCAGGKCNCRPGFIQVNDTFPMCQKTCNILTQTNVEGSCFNKVQVGDPCISSGQCPARSICREGVCICDCNSALSKNSCIDPDDPGGTGKLTDIITNILNPGGAAKGGGKRK